MDNRVASFAPRVAPGCRVLILGTAPSARSLVLQQAYGHAQNLFWPFMGELFDAGPQLDYEQRIARLFAAGVGIWDVLQQCERPGSLDSAIVRASEVPNAIPQLLAMHPSIGLIALNGGKALALFQRHIQPQFDGATRQRLQLLALPSTSPANASISRADKWLRWRELRQACPGSA